MTNEKKKSAGGLPKPTSKITKRVHSNSSQAQRQRLLAWFRAHGMIDTITARRDLDILMPAARVHELRHRYGLEIHLIWVQKPTDCGHMHRVGQYVLHPSREFAYE